MTFCSFRMFCTCALICTAFLLAQSASAGIPRTTSGGSSGSPFKAAEFGEDLYCDLNDARSRLEIFANPSNAEPDAPVTFELSGRMACVEVPQGTVNPGLQKGKDLIPDDNKNEPTVGVFFLRQITLLAEQITEAANVDVANSTFDPVTVETAPGFGYASTPPIRTWNFQVSGATPPEGLLYVLEAYDDPNDVPDAGPDQNALQFCRLNDDDVPVGEGSEVCQVVYGLDITQGMPIAGDYNANPPPAGQALEFSASPDGTEELGNLFWEPCHIQAHVNAPEFSVHSVAHGSGNGAGLGLDTGIDVLEGESLIITQVDPRRDLWTSGARPRHSNADGQVRYLRAIEGDDSGFPPGTLIGTNWEDFRGGTWEERGFEAAFGTLVGGIQDPDNETVGNFFRVGAAFNGTAPAEGRLRLFYWDNPLGDNAGDIAVRVVAGRPIRCQGPEGRPASVRSEVFNVDQWYNYTIVPQPTLNVASKGSGGTPITLLSCAPDDSPFDQSQNTIRINNVPVPFRVQNISNSYSGFSCEPGQSVEAVKLSIKTRDLLGALAIEACNDGAFTFPIAGETTSVGGWFRGNATTNLTNCNKLIGN